MRPLLGVVCLLLGVAIGACSSDQPPSIGVDLSEWFVRPSQGEVRAGRVTFTAHNRSAGMVHELAILRLENGDKTEVKEIEDINPGKSASVTVTLKPGDYELACLIVPGEAGSAVDHYQQGMRVPFAVR